MGRLCLLCVKCVSRFQECKVGSQGGRYTRQPVQGASAGSGARWDHTPEHGDRKGCQREGSRSAVAAICVLNSMAPRFIAVETIPGFHF